MLSPSEAVIFLVFAKRFFEMAKVPLTPQGAAKLEHELKELKQTKRPAIIQAISDARALGDLSENAEYHAAKEEQRLNESRISFLENALADVEIIDPVKIACDSVKFGATCTIIDLEVGERKTYQIVGREEADLACGKIALDSPIARALMGKKKGESFEFLSPRGMREFELVELEYK